MTKLDSIFFFTDMSAKCVFLKLCDYYASKESKTMVALIIFAFNMKIIKVDPFQLLDFWYYFFCFWVFKKIIKNKLYKLYTIPPQNYSSVPTVSYYIFIFIDINPIYQIKPWFPSVIILWLWNHHHPGSIKPTILVCSSLYPHSHPPQFYTHQIKPQFLLPIILWLRNYYHPGTH